MKNRLLISGVLLATGCVQAPMSADQAADVQGAADTSLGRCAAPHATIAAVQGSAASSPLLGQTVIVEGVVTGAFDRGLGGFFIQDPTPSLDAAVSTGLFVQTAGQRGSGPPEAAQAGDQVRVRGVVAELGTAPVTLTALQAPIELLGCGEGEPIAPVVLDAPPADWEALEGMLVMLPGPLSVNGNYALHRFGELQLSFGERLFQPTELHPPGPQAQTAMADNARRSVLVDDASSQQNPASVWFLGEATESLRAGSRVSGVRGIVDQRMGATRIQLVAPLGGIEPAERPAQPPAVPGDIRVAAFNLENFFNGDGAGGGFPTARGAQSPAEMERQVAKLIAALMPLQADIVALSEVENDGYGERSAIADFTRRLNAALGEPDAYRFVDPGLPALGTDAIAVGLLYRPSTVTPVGKPAVREGGPFARGSRVPIAAAFKARSGGPAFSVAAVHFKSKGSCPVDDPAASGPDANRGDGQACWNAARVQATQAVNDWLQTDPAGSGGALWMIAGDFNSYGEEDPLRLLRATGHVDAFSRHALPTRPYSYVFDGMAGRLDHVMLSPALAPYLAGAAHWHVNADESAIFGYSGDDTRWYRPDPFRSSDHDPGLVGLDFTSPR